MTETLARKMTAPVCQFEDRLSGTTAQGEALHSHDGGASLHAHDHGHGDEAVNEHGHTHEHLENAGESWAWDRSKTDMLGITSLPA